MFLVPKNAWSGDTPTPQEGAPFLFLMPFLLAFLFLVPRSSWHGSAHATDARPSAPSWPAPANSPPSSASPA
jgi:hypothetical protein